MSKIDRQLILNKYNSRCGYCGELIELKSMQVDHIIPRSEFLTCIKNNWKIPEFLKHLRITDVNHNDNLMPTCRVCNKWKANFSLEFFRKELKEQIKRLNDYSSNYRIAKKYNMIQELDIPVIFYFETLTLPAH